MLNSEITYEANMFMLVAGLLGWPDEALYEKTRALLGLYEPASERYVAIAKSLESDADLLDLQRDYTALFIGALKMMAPPYASYYLDGEGALGGPSCVEVEHAYAKAGYRFLPKRKCPADNLSVMCEFEFALLRKCLSEGNDGAKAHCLNEAAVFYLKYIRGWIPDLCERIKAFATTDFYRNMGSWLEGVLVEDCLLDEACMTELMAG